MRKFLVYLVFLFLAKGLFASYKVEDSKGSEFSFLQAPQRVACISPSVTELIFAIGASENLIANSRFCRFPPEALKKIKIGGYIDPNFEKIVEIKPDLFLLTASNKDIFSSKLDEFGIKHLSLHSDGLENILKNIAILGDVFQKQTRAKALISEIEESLAKTRQKAKSLSKKRAILLFGQMAAGENSYAGELLDIAGAINIMRGSSSSWAVPEKEYIMTSMPEIIILESKSPQDFESQRKFYLNDSIWKNTPAVKNNKIYSIDSDLISIPCTHIIGATERLSDIVQDAN